MSKKNLETIDFESFKLSNFSYKVVGCVKDARFNQVECDYICNGTPVRCFIDYPKGYCKNDAEFIEKAKEYIKIVTDNGEIYKYTSEYLKNRPYKFITPLNLGNLTLKEYAKIEGARRTEDLYKAKEKQIRAKQLEAKKAEEQQLKEEEKKNKEILKRLEAVGVSAEASKRIKELMNQNALLIKENDKLKNNSLTGTKIDKKTLKLLEKESSLSSKEAMKQAKIDAKLAAKQAKLDAKVERKANKGGGGKGSKVGFILTSFTTIVAAAAAVFLYLQYSKIKQIEYVTISYDLKDGIKDGRHFVSSTIKKGSTWSEIKSSAPKDVDFGDSYTFENWQINEKTIADNHSFDSDTIIEANSRIKDPTKDFDKDGFAVIANVANNGIVDPSSNKTIFGLEALKETYKPEGGTFIGKTKKIKLDGSTIYTVRVIDEKHDDLFDVKNFKATLTFEFVNIIDTELSFSTSFDNTNKYDGQNNIYNNLNNVFVNRLPNDLINSLEYVKKSTARGGLSDPTQIDNTRERIFMLSAKEMNYSGDFPCYKGSVPLNEGTSYKYYENATAQDKIKKKIDGDAKPSSYYLRTPDYNNNCFAWNVNSEGALGELNSSKGYNDPISVTEARGIVPCFCIGHEMVE